MNKKRGKDLNTLFSRLSSLEQNDLEVIEEFIRFIKLKQKKKIVNIPCEIFEKRVSLFESIVKFLREQHKLSYKEISKLLKRKPSTIGVVYMNAKLKSKLSYSTIKPKVMVNANIFSHKLTILESIVIELKEKFSLKEISQIIKRSYGTVWATYKKGLGKIKNVR